ncbi:MAG TPA: dienelactone hydrolase family protein [Ktedonobacterales bacterium]|jgi:carboxymethylenebutenolidase
MCYDLDALPPEPPFHGAAARTDELVLTSADGTRFAAFAARASAPTGAGIVILPDVRGLFQFYKDLAVRFAEAGVEAVAIDYFGRTAGLGARGEEFEYMPHVQQTQAARISDDVAAAITYLRSEAGGAPKAIFTVGFCFGGGNSFQQAANKHGLAGVIGFYGSPTAPRAGAAAPIDRIGEFTCPVMGLFGGADQGIAVSDVHKFDQSLAQAGIEHEIVIYPDAPHSFFDRRFEQYTQECADAWRRMVGFIKAHTPGA